MDEPSKPTPRPRRKRRRPELPDRTAELRELQELLAEPAARIRECSSLVMCQDGHCRTILRRCEDIERSSSGRSGTEGG